MTLAVHDRSVGTTAFAKRLRYVNLLGGNVPEHRIAATAVVRVTHPPEMTRAEFLASMRVWLDHQCIVPAHFLSGPERIFDVAFDNPRDARLFARRFAGRSILSPTPADAELRDRNRLARFRDKLSASKEIYPSRSWRGLALAVLKAPLAVEC